MQLEKLGMDYLDRRAALFDAVTLDQARAVAHRLLDPDRLSFAVVGDPAGDAVRRTTTTAAARTATTRARTLVRTTRVYPGLRSGETRLCPG